MAKKISYQDAVWIGNATHSTSGPIPDNFGFIPAIPFNSGKFWPKFTFQPVAVFNQKKKNLN